MPPQLPVDWGARRCLVANAAKWAPSSWVETAAKVALGKRYRSAAAAPSSRWTAAFAHRRGSRRLKLARFLWTLRSRLPLQPHLWARRWSHLPMGARQHRRHPASSCASARSQRVAARALPRKHGRKQQNQPKRPPSHCRHPIPHSIPHATRRDEKQEIPGRPWHSGSPPRRKPAQSPSTNRPLPTVRAHRSIAWRPRQPRKAVGSSCRASLFSCFGKRYARNAYPLKTYSMGEQAGPLRQPGQPHQAFRRWPWRKRHHCHATCALFWRRTSFWAFPWRWRPHRERHAQPWSAAVEPEPAPHRRSQQRPALQHPCETSP